MSTVAIVGAGHVAGATAHALAVSDRVVRLLLIDEAASAARGKALDIRQAAAIVPFHTRLDGTDDLSRVTGCSVCIIADRFGSEGEWMGDEGLAMIKRLTPYLGKAPLVFAGASQGGLIAFAATEAGIDRRRLIGSSPEALVSSVVAVTALEAGCSPREVMLTVLGAPAPASFVVPWSEGTIGGYPLPAVLSQVALARLEARVRHLWPPGPYVLGAAAARITAALVTSSRQSFSVLTQLRGEFGVRDRPGILPARLAAGGIVQTRMPELTTRERVQLQAALGG